MIKYLKQLFCIHLYYIKRDGGYSGSKIKCAKCSKEITAYG